MTKQPALEEESTAGRDFLLYGPRLLYETYRRNWRLLLCLCGLFGAVFGFMGYRMWKPRWEARSTLKLRENDNTFQDRFNSETVQRDHEAQLTADNVLAQALKNPEVAAAFVGEADPVALLRRRLKATVVGSSRIINVIYGSEKPDYADKVVNTVVENYLASKTLEHDSSFGKKLANIDKQIASRKLEEAADRAEQQKLARENDLPVLNERGIDGMGNALPLWQQRIAELENQRSLKTTRGNQLAGEASKFSAAAVIESKLEEEELQTQLRRRSEEKEKAEKQLLGKVPGMALFEAATRAVADAEAKLATIREALRYRKLLAEYDSIKVALKVLESEIANAEAQKNRIEVSMREKQKVWLDLSVIDRRIKASVDAQNTLTSRRIVIQNDKEVGMPLELLNPAAPPRSPVEDGGPWRRALIFGLGGALLPFLLLVAREFLTQPITSSADLSRATQLPLVGEIATIGFAGRNLRPTKKGIRSHVERARFEESIDYLRVSLLSSGHATGKDLRVIAVVSAKPREGKTTLAAYLARSFANGVPGRVLLVDGDMRCPRLHEIIGGTSDNGLADYLLGRIDFAEAVRPTDLERLDFLPAGRLDVSASRALADDQFGCFIQMARQRYEYIIVDTPPILPVGDAAIIGAAVDGAVLCALRDQSSAEAVSKARQRLESAGVRVLGVVLNGAPPGYFGSADYYYTRGQRAAAPPPGRLLEPPKPPSA